MQVCLGWSSADLQLSLFGSWGAPAAALLFVIVLYILSRAICYFLQLLELLQILSFMSCERFPFCRESLLKVLFLFSYCDTLAPGYSVSSQGMKGGTAQKDAGELSWRGIQSNFSLNPVPHDSESVARHSCFVMPCTFLGEKKPGTMGSIWENNWWLKK